MRVFSGIQPTGKVHLGNYFGALINWVHLQNKGHDCYFSIVDLHAITQKQDPKELARNTLELAATLLAIGIDPKKSTLFLQSSVPAHTQLAWILTCLTPMGEMERMIQFKEKSAQNKNLVNAGLFSYPILQAADIMLYKANMVPIGVDQAQHLELARKLIKKFNRLYCPDNPLFTEPETLHTHTQKIIGLDGTRKMSKSFNNYIALTDSEDELKKKLAGAKTDPARIRRSDAGNPDECNVFSFHTLFSPKENQEWAAAGCRQATIGCMDCKKNLHGNLNNFLAPIRERYHDWISRPDDIREILNAGSKQAQKIAQQTIDEVHKLIGFHI